MTVHDLDALLMEGDSVPVEGWDFGWFDGRATEERPPWRYAVRAAERASSASTIADLQTGGAEVYAWVLEHAHPSPPSVLATESWAPNLAVARRRLADFDADVRHAPDDAPLPFEDGTVDLVLSRHPTVVRWGEIARVLRPGGTYLSQQIGTGTNRELYEFFLGPQPGGDPRGVEGVAAAATADGLSIVDVREATTRVEFFDVAAVVYFLRKVIWTVPGFTVDRYRDRLADMHRIIEGDGSFVSHSRRVLVEASHS